MTEAIKILADSQAAEAANASAVSKEADLKAQASQMEAAVETAISKFFNRGVQEKKFIDIGRIPFICDDISGIHSKLEKMVTKEDIISKEAFALLQQSSTLTTRVVFAFIAVICLAFVGALLTQHIK